MSNGVVDTGTPRVLKSAYYSDSTQARQHDGLPQQTYPKSIDGLQPQFIPPTPPESVAPLQGLRGIGSRRECSDESERSQYQAVESCFTVTESQSDTNTSRPSSGTCSPSMLDLPNCQNQSTDCRHTIYQQPNYRAQLLTVRDRVVNSPSKICLEPTTRSQRPLTSVCDVHEPRMGTSHFDDSAWEQSQSYNDFREDPAHEFWKWDQSEQHWFHRDEDTGSVIWCPTELD